MNGTDKDKLIAAGAGSAIGATFNAPIAGTIFVLEELLQRFSSSLLFPVLASTVTAASVARYFLGNYPSFKIPHLDGEMKAAGIVVCVVLGLTAGILGVFFSRLIYFFNSFWARQKKYPDWVKPALAGLLVGIIGLIIPLSMGTGNTAVGLLLHNKLSFVLVLAVFVIKFVLTPLCFGSGAAGGIFLPILMLGSFLGYMLASLAAFMGFDVNIAAISLVGMAAFLAAVARAPITAVVMVFEMTGGYNYILPIMLSAAIADLTARRMHHKPIYARLMLDQAQNSPEARVLGKLSARSIMTDNVHSFPDDMSLEEALQIIKEEKHLIFPVVDKRNRLLGIISRSDINDALVQGNSGATAIEQIMNPKTVVAYPDTDLYTLYFRLRVNNSQRAVVIDRARHVKGIITRNDVYNAAEKAVAATIAPVLSETKS